MTCPFAHSIENPPWTFLPAGATPNGRHGCVCGSPSGLDEGVFRGPTGVHWSCELVPFPKKGAQMSSIGAVWSPQASESPSYTSTRLPARTAFSYTPPTKAASVV